ncbi:MAG: MFS transporter [Acidimicrobiia bacterium]|nr:MFS transporter [Acidimicrobiia bacterium]
MQETVTKPGFSGWRVVGFAILLGGLTGPGQTIGVSVFVNHFIEDLQLSRSAVSTAYLVGTLTASLGLPLVGRFIDARGVRLATTLIGALFGLALVAMSGVGGLITLGIGFVFIRFLGQGSLSLASGVAVTHWFESRRGLAIGVLATGVSALMGLAPVLLNLGIESFGWRATWIVAGVVIWLTVVPIARFGLIDKPGDVGQIPDGQPAKALRDGAMVQAATATRAQALRTVRFWILTGATMSVAMLITGLNFQQIDILTDAGLTETQAAATFLPQVLAASLAGIGFGFFTDRLPGRVMVPAAMALMVLSLVLVGRVTPGVSALIYVLAMGATGGAMRSVDQTLLPRWFGVGHIGAIRGVATFAGVAATAAGPITLSLLRDATGSYGQASALLASIPLVIGVVAFGLPDERQKDLQGG